MRKKIFFLLLFLSSFLFVQKALAHVLQTDRSIGAILHIDPDDDPIAGQQSNFFFELKDTSNRFQSTNCYCRIDILQHGKIIYSDALFQQSINKNTDSTYDSFIFPTRDVYQIQFIGKPRNGNGFQSFLLTYDIRVDRETDASIPTTWFSTHLIHLGTGIVIIIFGIFFLLQKIFQKQKNIRRKDDNNKHDEKNLHNYY